MLKKCPVCQVEMPIFKAYCSLDCVRKGLPGGLFPARSEKAKRARKIEELTATPITDRISL